MRSRQRCVSLEGMLLTILLNVIYWGEGKLFERNQSRKGVRNESSSSQSLSSEWTEVTKGKEGWKECEYPKSNPSVRENENKWMQCVYTWIVPLLSGLSRARFEYAPPLCWRLLLITGVGAEIFLRFISETAAGFRLANEAGQWETRPPIVDRTYAE